MLCLCVPSLLRPGSVISITVQVADLAEVRAAAHGEVLAIAEAQRQRVQARAPDNWTGTRRVGGCERGRDSRAAT